MLAQPISRPTPLVRAPGSMCPTRFAPLPEDFAELKKKLEERKSLVEAFNVYDKDGDGEEAWATCTKRCCRMART